MRKCLLICWLISLLVACSTAESTVQPTTSPTISPILSTETPIVPTITPIRPTATAVSQSSANANVIFVKAEETAPNVWRFSVTVEHPDTGWDDYADGWDVVLPDGTVIKPNPDSPFTRLLTHPHETEQPFTRSQANIDIPSDITQVTVRAHDLVDGFGGRTVIVDLMQESGTDFEVIRK